MASMLKLISLLVPALAFFTQEDTASQQPLKRKNQYTMATNKHARAESKFRVVEVERPRLLLSRVHNGAFWKRRQVHKRDMRFQGSIGTSDFGLLCSVEHLPHLVCKLYDWIIFVAWRGQNKHNLMLVLGCKSWLNRKRIHELLLGNTIF